MIRRVGSGDPFSWPPGWTVTYVLARDGAAGRRPVQAGIIASDAEISAKTGKVMVPVRHHAAPPGTITCWVDESDIIQLTPPQSHTAA